jgi:predicted O-methyltransferase YrrM
MKQDWSSPVTVASEIDTSKVGAKRDLPGIRMDKEAIRTLGVKLGKFAVEFPWKSAGSDAPAVPWGYMFPTMDSLVLYSMIRHFKPSRYIEVGCGYSSRVSSAACEMNRLAGADTRTTYIEPYPGERLEKENLRGELIVKRIQDVPLEVFAALQPGDMLFIDTSHIMKCQSDVEWELLHILPTLRPGVIIHVHDIYTPFDYPPDWLDNNYAPGQYNEQYALEALMSGGNRFQCLFPVHALCRENAKDLQEWFGVPSDESRSFWMSVS